MLELVKKSESNSQNPEHDLILICDRLENANKALHQFFASDMAATSGAALDANQTQWEELAYRAAALPATTLDGVRARVRALGCEFVADILRSAEATDDAERIMIEALIRDLTAGN